MSIPKRRKSHGKVRKGRSHLGLGTVKLTKCSKCADPKPPHQVCKNCGFYGERDVLNLEKKKLKREKREKLKKQEREQQG